MLRGVYKITAIGVVLPRDGPIGGGNVSLSLVLGSQTATFRGKGYQIKLNQVVLFEVVPQEKLQVSVYEKESDQKIGYAEVLMTPLLKIPYTRHQVTIHSVFKDRMLAIQDKESAVIDLQIFYTEVFESTFEVILYDANLTRDTDKIGKMQLFTEMRLGSETRISKPSKQGKSPIWNQNFSFNLTNPSERLSLVIHDKDLMDTEVVATQTLPLRQLGLLKPTNDFHDTNIEVFFEGKRVGIMRIGTRFTVTKMQK